MKTSIHLMVISRSVFRSMRDVSEDSCRGNHKAHFMFKHFFPENRAFYETMWKNIVDPGGLQLTIWRMRIACWIPKATNTDLEYETLITFALQQNGRASILCYTYVHCLSCLFLLSEGTSGLHMDGLLFWVWEVRGQWERIFTSEAVLQCFAVGLKQRTAWGTEHIFWNAKGHDSLTF